MNLKDVTLADLAALITKDWKNPNFGAKPYILALACLEDIDSAYYCDSGRSIVAYFLSNASTWKGEVAKAVKLELNRRLK
jgi:hypothetical protein